MAQPILPVGFDPVSPQLVFWDSATSTWLAVPFSFPSIVSGVFVGIVSGLNTVTAAGVLAGAVVVASWLADVSEDSFGNTLELVGPARDGEFDIFCTGPGSDNTAFVSWMAVNP